MSFEPRDYLQHVLVEADYLLRESAGVTAIEFMANETLQRAFVRSLEIIGEATKQIPEDFRRAHSGIDWRGMAGMRDRLIHGYFGVDYAIVWDVVQNHIPVVQREVRSILQS
jgi:uncharacterized protein with HEPN domain